MLILRVLGRMPMFSWRGRITSVRARNSRARRAVVTMRAFGALIVVLAAFAWIGSAPAAADENLCPASGTGNPQTDDQVAAAYSISGESATYKFSSLVNESPSGGVPGLIAYCVYPGSQPDSVSVEPGVTGANGEAWVDPAGFDN